MNIVLLRCGKWFVIEKGTDGRAKIGSFNHISVGQTVQKLPEILYRRITERLEDDGALLCSDSGVCQTGERRETGQIKVEAASF